MSIDTDETILVADYGNHRIVEWKMNLNESQIIVGGNGKGNHLDQFSNPRSIFIGEGHSVYVSDYGNHRGMKWVKGAIEGIVE